MVHIKKKNKLKDNQGQLCGWSSILCCIALHSAQFSCSIVSDSLRPHGLSLPGFPVCHQLPELAQLVSIESVMPSNHLILLFPSPPAFNLYQHQGLF